MTKNLFDQVETKKQKLESLAHIQDHLICLLRALMLATAERLQ